MTAGRKWVEVTRRYPLWASIPAEERLTVAEILQLPVCQRGISYTWQARLDVLGAETPPCAVATQMPEFPRKWAPCPRPVAVGASRCKMHGGPSVNPERPKRLTREELEEENKALKRQLAALASRIR